MYGFHCHVKWWRIQCDSGREVGKLEARIDTIREKLNVSNIASCVKEPVSVPEHVKGGGPLRACCVGCNTGRSASALPSRGPSQLWSCCPPTPLGVCSGWRDWWQRFWASAPATAVFTLKKLASRSSEQPPLSTAPLLLHGKPVHAEKTSVVPAAPGPLSCRSRQLLSGVFVTHVSSLESGVRGRASSLFPQLFSQTLWLRRELWLSYQYDMKTRFCVCYI